MQDQSLDVRLAIVEHDAKQRGELMQKLVVDTAAQTGTMHSMDKKLDSIVFQLANLQDLPQRVKSLEDTRTEARGGWKMILAAGASGAGIVKLLEWLRTTMKP